MRYLIFFGVVLLVVGGTHTYFFVRLARDTGLLGPRRLAVAVALALLAFSLPASFLLLRPLSPQLARPLLYPVYVWMGLMLFLTTFLLMSDLARWGYQLLAWLSGNAVTAQQRLLLGRWQALLALGAALLAGGYSVQNALGRPVVRRLELSLPGLSSRLDGTTIAQLTDLHLGVTLGRRWLERVVVQVNALSPDLVAITGDLVDGRVEQLRPVVAPLSGLKSRHGVFFVTGNHEYYSGVQAWMRELPKLGLRLLRNQRVRIGGEDGFELAGVDDFSAGGMHVPGHGPDLTAALAGLQPGRALVLLAHQPRAVAEAAQRGVGLQLSGHTHGGQLWPWRYLVRLQQPVISGLTRVGQTLLYVSDGTGFWGPPMRLGTRPEITLITLRARP